MFNLKLIPIQQLKGKTLLQASGFVAANPLRRSVRSRAEDLLVISFIPSDADRLTPDLQSAWLANLLHTFYKTSGSVTSALRVLVETINLAMMEMNLKSARKEAAVTGSINLAAIHRRSLFVVQSGLAHAFTLTHEGLKHFYDASKTDRGMGISRTPKMRYFQADLGEESYLFITDNPPNTWLEERLTLGGFPNLDQLRRRLLNQASPDFRLDLVQITVGDGQIATVQPIVTEHAEVEQPAERAEDIIPVLPPIVVERHPVQADDSAISDTQKIDLEDAEPEDAKLEDAKLEDAEPEDAKLEDAKPEDAELEDAELEDAELEDVELEDAKLEDAKPEDAELEDAELEDAELEDVELEDAELKDAELEDAELEDAKLEDGKLEDVKERALADETQDEEKSEVDVEQLSAVEEKKPELVHEVIKTSDLDEMLEAEHTPSGKGVAEIAPGEDQALKKKTKKRHEETLGSSFKDRAVSLWQEGLHSLVKFFDWRAKTGAKAEDSFKKLSSRVGLTDDQGTSTLSTKTQLLITILVPLVVVAIALGVYLSRGKTLQYQHYLQQAELASIVAATSEDPIHARQSWADAVMFLDLAESYRRTDEVAQKRADAQRALDFLDGAARLSFHPVIAGTLADGINITRMISYGLDLYLLDSNNGQVIHATRSSKGYQVDPKFECHSGNYRGGAVDALVDMVPLPINNPYQAHILGADAIGNVIFCGPGQPPTVQTLPQGSWPHEGITRVASEGDRLYVLDTVADSIRVYWAVNGQYLDEPNEYFGGEAAQQKPPLGNIVDLAVDGADLYLLRNDGKIVSCAATGLPGNPVNCENPVEYQDGRPGKEGQPVIMPDTGFVSIMFTQPPLPAIHILDGVNGDIFRFSVRFRLDKRLRSDFGEYELAAPMATAFTIAVDRTAFIAFGNQVFYAFVE